MKGFRTEYEGLLLEVLRDMELIGEFVCSKYTFRFRVYANANFILEWHPRA